MLAFLANYFDYIYTSDKLSDVDHREKLACSYLADGFCVSVVSH